jgi:hypothetical protein
MAKENTETGSRKPEGIIREFRELSRIEIGRVRCPHRAVAIVL